MPADTPSGPVALVLDQLTGVRRSGDGWTARCPAHDDGANSLSIGTGDDGRALLNCFAGCPPERIVAAIGLTLADLFPRSDKPGGGGTSPPGGNGATGQHPPSCTLAQYAEAKRLPLDRLRAFGLSDVYYSGTPAVRIPYRDGAGLDVCVRFRIRLAKAPEGDDRFRWKSGSKPRLYGLDRLDAARERGYVALVEGESDCHTLWCHDEPAVGVAGATLWRDDRDAPDLDGIPTVYLVHEPDRGGDALLRRVAASPLRERVRLVRLDPHKDASALYLDDPDRFAKRWAAALAASVPLAEYVAENERARHAERWAACADLAREPDILAHVAEAVEAAGVAGEARVVKLLYLVVTSRFLDKPASAVVKGPSSGGKSYLVDSVLTLFPAEAYYALSAMSERSLAYSTEPLVHRILVIYEAAGLSGDFASYLVRSLLSEGRVRYETVESTSAGLKPKLIEREGPTGLIVTTTAVHLHPENETRLLSLTINDSTEQTKRVLIALATGPPTAVDRQKWHALQAWLAGAEHRVEIPFARPLADLVPPVAVRLRRDFGLVLTLIRAHALLHQAKRPRDAEGRVVATLADYGAVRELVADLLAEGVEATVPATVRETVEMVERLIQLAGHDRGDDDEDPSVSVTTIAKALKVDKSAASRRVRVAIDREYLKNLETRKGRPARIALGEKMPNDVPILPPVADLARCCGVDVGNGDAPDPPPSPNLRTEPFTDAGKVQVCVECQTAPIAPGRKYLCDACAEKRGVAA
jgi:hypothetical protein